MQRSIQRPLDNAAAPGLRNGLPKSYPALAPAIPNGTHVLERIPESEFDELPLKGFRNGGIAVYKGKQVRITKAFHGMLWIAWNDSEGGEVASGAAGDTQE